MFGHKNVENRLGRVEDGLREAKDAIADLRTELRSLKLESENVYSAAYLLHEKIRKRLKSKAEPDVPEVTAEEDLNEKIRKGLPV